MLYRPINADPTDVRLGRFIPDNFDHVEKYPYAAIAPESVSNVEKSMRLPSWHWTHNQGSEGSCVGHGVGMERAITNTAQNIVLNKLGIKTARYDTIDIWNMAKKIDPWPNTNPGDDNGTSVHAGYDVARTLGLRPVKSMVLRNDVPTPVGEGLRSLDSGTSANRWATTVDQMRTGIAAGLPVTIGINWYSNFDTPVQSGREFWIGKGSLGSIRGGHCVCLYGASDTRQAFLLKNSWGKSYPLVWLTYAAMTKLLSEQGEAALVTDR